MNFDPNTGEPINNVQQPNVAPKKSNGVAIAGFVLALVGGFLLDIVGLILSIVGLNKSKECNSGKGLAIAGIIIAIVKLVLGIIIVIACWGLILGLLGIVSEYQEYCTKPETICSPAVDGFAECKYKDGSVTYTISCPADLVNSKTTEPTTKNVTQPVATKDAIEYKLDGADEGAQYYADIVYLKDNNLYGRISSKYASKVESDSTVNGVKTTLLVQNVKKVWTPEFGQGGYQDVIFTDLRGDTYRLNNIPSDITERKNEKALGITKLTGVTDVKDVYTLGTDGAWDYVIINNKNQIIYSDLEEYSTYLYFDKKNNRGENLIGSDVYKLEIDKTEKGSEDTTVIYFNVYKNGSKLSDQVKYEFLGTFSDYETVGLIPIRRCKSGSDLAFESKCE